MLSVFDWVVSDVACTPKLKVLPRKHQKSLYKMYRRLLSVDCSSEGAGAPLPRPSRRKRFLLFCTDRLGCSPSLTERTHSSFQTQSQTRKNSALENPFATRESICLSRETDMFHISVLIIFPMVYLKNCSKGAET